MAALHSAKSYEEGLTVDRKGVTLQCSSHIWQQRALNPKGFEIQFHKKNYRVKDHNLLIWLKLRLEPAMK